MLYKELSSLVIFCLLSICEGAIPGTFFWRPRLGIDLAIPTTETAIAVFQPNKKNVQAGLVVLVDGYDIMTSLLGLVQSVKFALDDDTMNPGKGIYYTNAYRWALRTLDTLPHWFRGNFREALAVWHNRYKYLDAELPTWVRHLFPWVPAKSWDNEKKDLIKYRKFSESSFTQFYRFPSKVFNNFESFLPNSVENFVFSSVERSGMVAVAHEAINEEPKIIIENIQANEGKNITITGSNETKEDKKIIKDTSKEDPKKVGGKKPKSEEFNGTIENQQNTTIITDPDGKKKKPKSEEFNGTIENQQNTTINTDPDGKNKSNILDSGEQNKTEEVLSDPTNGTLDTTDLP